MSQLPSLKAHIDHLVANTNEDVHLDENHVRIFTNETCQCYQPHFLVSVGPEITAQYKSLVVEYLKLYYSDVDGVVNTRTNNFGLWYKEVAIGVFDGFSHVATILVNTQELINKLAPMVFAVSDDCESNLGKYVKHRRQALEYGLALHSAKQIELEEMIEDRISCGVDVFDTCFKKVDFTKISVTERNCIDLWYGLEETLQFDY